VLEMSRGREKKSKKQKK